MPTVKGEANDPVQPGVLGTPMDVFIPGTTAIGVLGEGGAGFPGVPGPGAIGRTAIGVMGTSGDPFGAGVFGKNAAGGNGVMGQSASGDGVLGISGSGVGVHGKGARLAGLFEGDVTITGKLNHGG